ncbi:hypothetical protein WICMUC_002904 [Wickerhamomyces mucosus]|uniref:VLRF1 domain-containing protein n=1 Tax=Wickerhamomyces mucosus TaxID=1378264 RepID=A0A9P8PP55_9ASCO|nr:hypothetical protein WICMUC_002904 [Wickerhamomyces mucosus]
MSIDKSINQYETYVFQISDRVLNSLQLMHFDSSTTEEILPQPIKHEEDPGRQLTKENSPELIDKEFYKSDLYRFNLKRKLLGVPTLSEEEFEKLVDEQNESISGSDDSENDESQDDEEFKPTDKLETVFEKSIEKLQIAEAEEENFVSHLATRSPYILFKSDLLDEEKAFGVYKPLFNANQTDDPLAALKQWQSSALQDKKSAVFMIGGGHFAGAIVSHKPRSTKNNIVKPGDSSLEQSVEVLKHKSFHRYTTRRKQGGSQSASDNSRGKANSAGSSLRRQNEAMLQQEVRELLKSWETDLNGCEFIFIKANGSSNRKILVGYEGAVLESNDARLRTFPFTTKRATTTELKRAWVKLTHIHIINKPKIDEKQLKQKQTQEQLKQSTIQKVKKVDELSDDEKHSKELINYLKRGRAPLIIAYIKKHKLESNIILKPESEFYATPTLLHYASANGFKNLIGILIKTIRVDPALQNKANKTPYDLAANRQTRQAFQIARYELGENFTNWGNGHVGDPISRDDVEKLEKKQALQEEEEKKNLIKQALAKPVKSSEENLPVKKLGGLSLNQANLSSLTDDQRMRLMREQRARAAEARFKIQQGK